jgi:hypothetical protein
MMQGISESYEEKINRISDLLAKRAAMYPVRDKIVFPQLIEVIEEFTTYLIQTTDFEGFQPEPERLTEIEQFIDNPVFICGAMKSGTTLLTQLLDNHPQLLVMPADSHYINFFNKWKRTQFVDIAAYWMQRIINPSGKEPFWFLGDQIPVLQTFLKYLNFFLLHTNREVFLCVVMAIYAANPRRSHQIRYWVEKTPQNELHLPLLLEKHPHARFIHIIRDPLTNIASLKKLAQYRGQENFLTYGVSCSFRKLLQTARNNQRRLRVSQYHLVKYETLTSLPYETIVNICEFLGVSFHENLLTPTENGRVGVANSMYQESRVQGKILDQSKNTRFLQELSKTEVKEIVKNLYFEALDFGYEWYREPLLQYRPPLWLYRMKQLAPEPFLNFYYSHMLPAMRKAERILTALPSENLISDPVQER